MEIWYVRHGQTDWNVAGKIQGSTDIPLNETGIQQAYQTQALLASQTFDLVLSSPLSRAYETAQIICADNTVEIIKDDRLVERNFGIYEGVLVKDLPVQDFWNLALDLLPEGGESTSMVFTRMYKLLDDLKAEYGDKKLLLVAHGGIAIPLRCYFEGVPTDVEPRSLIIHNCDYVSYVVNPAEKVENPYDQQIKVKE